MACQKPYQQNPAIMKHSESQLSIKLDRPEYTECVRGPSSLRLSQTIFVIDVPFSGLSLEIQTPGVEGDLLRRLSGHFDGH